MRGEIKLPPIFILESREDSKMDTYTVALIVLAVAVVGGFSYILLRPEKSQ